MIARVEPLTSTRAVRGPFDYQLSPDQRDVEVGSLLRVPFGRRRTLGVVVELAGASELAPERLAEPETVLPSSVPRDLVRLAGWMAEQYCSTPARALGLVLPPGATAGVASRRVLMATITDAGLYALAGNVRLTERQRAILKRLDREGPAPASAIGTAPLRRLEGRGFVELDAREQERRPVIAAVGVRRSVPPVLSGDQAEVLGRVLDALSAEGGKGHRSFLLHGVTGSGKTEVYLRAVEATLAAGRDAIVLVPEIALTPQTLARFRERFNGATAVLHSALSKGERHDEWMRLRRRQARVCIGPRSAVFAPLSNLGLIVIDEEHDSSYKHEGDPRYDARTVALRRAQEHGAVVLAGSATPRPESVVSMRRLHLADRIDRRPLPPVEVLDMRNRHHPLHPRASIALAAVRRERQKAIVLLNRRGWSNFLSCRDCGEVCMCPNCEVTLVLHRLASVVACHHCGHRQPVPERCAGCNSVALARHGSGTERLEEELSAALGGDEFPIFRLDADAGAGKDRVLKTLVRFDSAPAGVLVGTQMVAKGHDFPEVTLGVVVDADQTLRFPDFRAEERTFGLVTQLAGRVGRGEAGGRVLVQTLAPSARAIRFARDHDAGGFLSDELRRRKALLYPPFGSLVRVLCAGFEAADVDHFAGRIAARIAGSDASVLGPAPLFRLRGRARAQLVIKAEDRAAAIRAVGRAVDGLAAAVSRAGVSVSVDVDPQ